MSKDFDRDSIPRSGPHFVCLGAQKSGTTYIAHALHAHPEIQIPDSKELYYFSPIGEYKSDANFAQCNFGKDLNWYKRQFLNDTRKCGEISTQYLFDPGCAARIKSAFPEISVFAVLRNPVERAFSQYNMERFKTGKEKRPLLEIINKEPNNEIIRRGVYSDQLRPYFEEFEPDKIRVYIFDDMIRDPASFFHDLFRFLGVNPKFSPPALQKRMNRSRRTKYVFIPRTVRFTRQTLEKLGLRSIIRMLNNFGAGKLIRQFNNRYNQVAVDFRMTDVERSALHSLFVEDIEKLEILIDRDLSVWKA